MSINVIKYFEIVSKQQQKQCRQKWEKGFVFQCYCVFTFFAIKLFKKNDDAAAYILHYDINLKYNRNIGMKEISSLQTTAFLRQSVQDCAINRYCCYKKVSDFICENIK